MTTRLRIFCALLIGIGLLAAAPSHADVRTFRAPQHQGYRLDYCEALGQACGERVATQWCRQQGFEFASDWSIERGVGELMPTLPLDGGQTCHGNQCNGFEAITCGREGRSFRMPNLGAMTRATVITPDRRGTAPAIMPVEVKLLVPGCYQTEPGVLLCGTVHEYQHCRTLFAAGKILGCRAGLAFDGAFAEPIAANVSADEVELRSRASATVTRDHRGEGRVRGRAEFRVTFEVPAQAALAETCLQRDRYVYHPDGPRGGLSEISDTTDCAAPIEGAFEPHEDDLLRAYDMCVAHGAWGQTIEGSIELLVSSLFHMSPMTAADQPAGASRIVAPYLTLRAPLEISCRD